MKQKSLKPIADALANKGEFFRVILIGSLLALGINLITTAFDRFFTPQIIAIAGVIITLLSILLLGIEVFRGRRISTIIEAVLVYDKKNQKFWRIHEYDFSEQVTDTLTAIFQENPAFKVIWDKEPPEFRRESSDKLSDEGVTASSQEKQVELDGEKGAPSYTAIVRIDHDEKAPEPKSFEIVREVIEFVVLERLSLHLSSYFTEITDNNEKYIKEYLRNDFPELLLRNRVLALLSSPLESRVPFSEYALSQKTPPGEIVALYRDDGTKFSRFDLMLPKGSKVFRTEPNILSIRSKRLIINLRVNYRGMNVSVPNDFLYYYVGTEEPLRIVGQSVEIEVEAILRPGVLLLTGGWQLYQWVDSFMDKFKEFGSFDAFLSRINWPAISADFYIHSRLQARQRAKKNRKQSEGIQAEANAKSEYSEGTIDNKVSEKDEQN